MSEIDKDYELNVLRMVVNQFLEKITSLTESSLNTLENNRDQAVWDVTTRIYRQSGYRIELSLVRDIVNSRIITIKNHLAEEERRAAEQKSQQEAEKVRRSTEQQEAEKARRAARQKAQQEAEEARRVAESNPRFLAKRKSEIFIRVRKVISEQLSVDEEELTLKSHLSLFANPLDLLELQMALEEEFEIEINDEDFTHALDVVYPSMGSLAPPSDGKIGEKAIIENLVEIIWENAPCFWENTSC